MDSFSLLLDLTEDFVNCLGLHNALILQEVNDDGQGFYQVWVILVDVPLRQKRVYDYACHIDVYVPAGHGGDETLSKIVEKN